MSDWKREGETVVYETKRKGKKPDALRAEVMAIEDKAKTELGGPVKRTSFLLNRGAEARFVWARLEEPQAS